MIWKMATLFLTVATMTWAIYEVRTERLDVVLLGSELRPTLSNSGS